MIIWTKMSCTSSARMFGRALRQWPCPSGPVNGTSPSAGETSCRPELTFDRLVFIIHSLLGSKQVS